MAVSKAGVVETVSPASVVVRLRRASACGGCSMSGHCNASECQETLVTVCCADAGSYAVGDSVVVSTTAASARLALLAGFGFPLVVLVTFFVLARYVWNCHDTVAAAIGLTGLAVYYILLYLCRGYVSQGVSFRIDKKQV